MKPGFNLLSKLMNDDFLGLEEKAGLPNRLLMLCLIFFGLFVPA